MQWNVPAWCVPHCPGSATEDWVTVRRQHVKGLPRRSFFHYDEFLRLGIHTFTGGSLERAALKASELGANTFQIFSASPRMWRARLPDATQVKLLRDARERFDLRPLAIHVNYLINLATR